MDRTETRAIRPRLSAFDATMIVVSLVIGIGIFRTPAIDAGAAGSGGWFLGPWALGGLVSLIGALTFAEIGSRLPRAGGYYRAVAECYHPRVAFMLNWSQVLMQGAGAAGPGRGPAHRVHGCRIGCSGRPSIFSRGPVSHAGRSPQHS